MESSSIPDFAFAPVIPDVRLDIYRGEEWITAFANDVLRGLSGDPRALPPKYFYDARGSALFDQITELPEYYPTRTEMAMMQAHAGEIRATSDSDAGTEFIVTLPLRPPTPPGGRGDPAGPKP